jgi:hypothetical protein
MKTKICKNILISVALISVFFPINLSATEPPPSTPKVDRTEYELLAPIPYVETTAEGKTTAAEYIPGAVKLVIILSGVLAVVMIMFGGIQYMSTDAISGKSDAKKTIQNAFWGLGLVLGAFLILNTINPALLNINIKLTRFAPPEVTPPTVGDQPGENPPGDGTGGGGNGGDGTLLPPSQAWRLVPENAPNPGGKCIDDRRDNGTNGEFTKDGERYPRCPDNTPTMVDLRVVLPEAGSRCVDPGPCKIHANGLPGMRRFVENAQRYNLSWQIIDAYPPTNDHKNICHQNGGCVDIQSIPTSIPGFIKLCLVARASRLDYLNESGTEWGNDSGILTACMKHNILQDSSKDYAQLHVFF